MAKKQKTKSIASLKKTLDKVFNAFIRRRDSRGGFFECISCGQTKSVDQMDAGHFYAKTFTALRWDEGNVWGQCQKCNRFLHGNLLEYRKGLVAKFSEDFVRKLDLAKHHPAKLDRMSLEYQISYYKDKLNNSI